jgi:hypothetical protein
MCSLDDASAKRRDPQIAARPNFTVELYRVIAIKPCNRRAILFLDHLDHVFSPFQPASRAASSAELMVELPAS